MEKTLSILKPDTVQDHHIGQAISYLEKGGLSVIASKMIQLSKEKAAQFYDIHQDKPFFNDLVSFISSGPIVVMVLEGENAILKNREIMGATNPKEAKPGTIRADFAKNIDMNAVHGSDGKDTAKKEISFFFTAEEIFSLNN